MQLKTGESINAFDDCENRYEPNQELKWLGDYLINSLVLCKNELGLESNEIISRLVELLWGTLDFKNCSDQISRGGSAVHERFNFLQRGLVELF